MLVVPVDIWSLRHAVLYSNHQQIEYTIAHDEPYIMLELGETKDFVPQFHKLSSLERGYW